MNKKIDIVDYFYNLDALRGIASLAVVFFHIPAFLVTEKSSATFKYLSILFSFNGQGGKLGVFFFFTLSGFLISYLLFTEIHLINRVNVFKFYIRRVLRIWPLYFLTIVIGFYLSPFIARLFGFFYTEQANINFYSLFISNFDVLYNTFPVNKILGTVWSVAIEEQFYLIWPLLFVLVKPKKIIYLFLVLFILSLFFNIYNYKDESLIYFHTLSCILYLSFGAIVAYFSFYYVDSIKSKLESISKLVNLFIYSISIMILFFNKEIALVFPTWLWFSKVYSTIFFSYVIIEQVYSVNSIFKLGKLNFLNFTGKLSYGVYLLHMISIYVINYFASNYLINIFFQVLLIILLTYILSFLSYKFFEKPFILLKKKFSFQ